MSTRFRLSAMAAVVAIAIGAAASPARADAVYGQFVGAANSTGSRSVGNPGLKNTDNDPDWADTAISWSVAASQGGMYSYTYTFTGYNKPAISHFTLDLTDGIQVTANTIKDAKLNGVSIAGGKIEFGNKEGITGAVKFDVGSEGTNVYTFVSDRMPVWGDFAVKGGRSAFLTNSGFGNKSLSDILHYIARPDGMGTPPPPPPPVPVPVPAAVWGGFALLAVLGGARVRRNRLDASSGV